MLKTLKKFSLLILTICMVVGLLPTATYAATAKDEFIYDFTEAFAGHWYNAAGLQMGIDGYTAQIFESSFFKSLLILSDKPLQAGIHPCWCLLYRMVLPSDQLQIYREKLPNASWIF